MTHKFIFSLLFFVLVTTTLSSCSNSNNMPLKMGDQAPLFSTIDIKGASSSLSDFKGQPVVIRFFLTDCKFCEADTPVFNAYYEKNKSKGLKMLYINSTAEDDSKVMEFAEMLKIPFPVIIDKEKKIADSYQIKALPQTVILSPDHKIKAAMLGGVSEDELDSILAEYLQ